MLKPKRNASLSIYSMQCIVRVEHDSKVLSCQQLIDIIRLGSRLLRASINQAHLSIDGDT